MERMNLFQDNNKPQITFYFAECMEFPDYGEYKEFPSLAQAISLFEKCPGTLLNAVKCVGFILHDDSIYNDVKQPLMTSKHVLKDDINYISHYANTTLVQEAIKEAECYLRSKENSKSKVTTGMFDNCDLLPAEMRENFKFTDEEIRYLSGVGEMFKNDKSVNFEIMEGPMPPAPIQDENRFICFRVEGKEYSLKIVSKEEMQRVKEEVNKNSRYTYDWFKEETGDHHWVLYNTDMYEIIKNGNCKRLYLHYKEDSNLAPVTPINMTSCYFMFAGCSKLIQLDLSGFDTRNVIDMRCMFEDCLRLTKLDLSSFKTSKVTLMISMFNSCVSLTQLDLSSFDTSSVISMSGMFYNCFSLAALNISNFNTSSVTEMDCMFTGCSNLVQLDVSKFDTSKVVTMFCMFSGCYKLIQLNLSNFDTKRVTNMASLFHNCQALAKLDISSFDTSQVTDMGAMFTYCSKLTQLDFTLFDTRNVTDTRWMFEHCEKLTTIFISDKWSMDRVTNAMDMFKECCSLPGFSPEKTGIEMAKPTEQGGYLTLKK